MIRQIANRTALPLFPYQQTGAAYLAKRECAGLFDEMGVGKTAQAIGAIDATESTRGIIVCPAAVRQVWEGEIKKFSKLHRRVRKAKSLDCVNMWIRGHHDILLCSYEGAASAHKAILAVNDVFDFIVFDEAHYLKNKQAARTKAMLGVNAREGGLARRAGHAWFLTGTPAPNDPCDLWTFLYFSGATKLAFSPFTARYFSKRITTYGVSFRVRDDTRRELQAVIASRSLRRTKESVGLELPPVFVTTLDVEGDASDVLACVASHPDLEQQIYEAVKHGSLLAIESEHVATLRRLICEAKAPAYVALLKEELKNGLDKIVVFTCHTRGAEIIAAALTESGIKATLFDGRTREADRVALVQSFQNDPEHRVFVANVKAGGSGLTLTAACNIDMFESSYTPAENAQALARVHRIGQNRNIRARFVSLRGSIDEKVTGAVARKTAEIAKII